MRRGLFNLAAAVSLLLCLAAVGLWVRSYRGIDALDRWDRTAVHVRSSHGRLVVHVVRHSRPQYGEEFLGWDVSRSAPPTAEERRAFASVAPPAGTSRRWRALGFEYLRGGPPVPGRVINGAWAAQVWRVGVPYWALFLGTAALPVARVLRARRLRSRRNFGLCPACGYDLRATPDRCPECGMVPGPAPRAAA